MRWRGEEKRANRNSSQAFSRRIRLDTCQSLSHQVNLTLSRSKLVVSTQASSSAPLPVTTRWGVSCMSNGFADQTKSFAEFKSKSIVWSSIKTPSTRTPWLSKVLSSMRSSVEIKSREFQRTESTLFLRSRQNCAACGVPAGQDFNTTCLASALSNNCT